MSRKQGATSVAPPTKTVLIVVCLQPPQNKSTTKRQKRTRPKKNNMDQTPTNISSIKKYKRNKVLPNPQNVNRAQKKQRFHQSPKTIHETASELLWARDPRPLLAAALQALAHARRRPHLRKDEGASERARGGLNGDPKQIIGPVFRLVWKGGRALSCCLDGLGGIVNFASFALDVTYIPLTKVVRPLQPGLLAI